jgi:hypothetical protein
MESRAIVAALLMAVLLIVYQMYFLGPGEPPKPPPKEPQAQAPPVPATAPAVAPTPVKPDDTPAPRTPRPPQRLATVESPSYTAVVSSEGGKLQEFNLKYRGDKPMVLVGMLGPTGLTLEMGGEREVVAMNLGAERLTLGPERPKGDLVLTGEVALRGAQLRDRHGRPHREPRGGAEDHRCELPVAHSPELARRTGEVSRSASDRGCLAG